MGHFRTKSARIVNKKGEKKNKTARILNKRRKKKKRKKKIEDIRKENVVVIIVHGPNQTIKSLES